MKFPIIFLATPLFALSNAVTVTDRSGAIQTNRPHKILREFMRDEICGYPQPFASGFALPDWQANVWTRWPASPKCPSGSVQQTHISWLASYSASQSRVFEFRDNAANSCGAGGVAMTPSDCDALAPSQSAILEFNSGNWGCAMSLTPVPASTGATARIVDCRAMISAGLWRFRLKGPLLNEIVVEDTNPSRSSGFGWANNYTVSLRGGWANPVNVYGISHWSSLASAGGLYVAIQNTNSGNNYNVGRVGSIDALNQTMTVASADEDGSEKCVFPACQHPWDNVRNVYRRTGAWIVNIGGADLYNNGPDWIEVNSPAGFSAGDVIQLGPYRAKIETVSPANRFNLASNQGGPYRKIQWHGQRAEGTLSSYLGKFLPVINLSKVSDYWADTTDEVHKALHPTFIVTQFTGWAGAGIEYGIDNTWKDRRLNQEYTVQFLRGASGSTPVAARVDVIHPPQTMNYYPDGPDVGAGPGVIADLKVWDGSVPGVVNYDFNLPYMRYAGVVPFDPDIVPTPDTMANILTNGDNFTGSTGDLAWDRGTKCTIETAASLTSGSGTIEYRGLYNADLPGAGGRWSIGLLAYPAGAAMYLMSHPEIPNSSRWFEVLFGQAACQEHVPIFWRDGANTPSYCNGGNWSLCPTCKSCSPANQAASTFGRWWSTDAYPGNMIPQEQFHGRAPWVSPLTDSWNTGLATFNAWVISKTDGMSHMQQPSFLPWLLFGRYRDERVLTGMGHYAQAATIYNAHDPVAVEDNYYWGAIRYRLNDWGFSYTGNGERQPIWATRDIGLGAYAAEAGTPEKEKLTHALDLQMYIRAGWWNVTDPAVYKDPCLSGSCGDMDSPWLFGRRRLGNNVNNGLMSPWVRNGPGCAFPEDNSASCVSTLCRYQNSPWEWNYGSVTLALLDNLGFASVTPIRRNQSNSIVQLTTHPAITVPWFNGQYRGPLMPVKPEGSPAAPGCQAQSYTFGDGSSDSFTSISNLVASFSPVTTALTGWDVPNTNNPIGGFVRWLHAAVMYATDGASIPVTASPGNDLTEARAQEFMRSTVPGQQNWGENPHLTFSANRYHRIDAIKVMPDGTGATITFPRPERAKSCKYAIGTSWPASSDDASDNPVTSLGPVQGTVTLSGLDPATTYVGRISCTNGTTSARSEFSFSTE